MLAGADVEGMHAPQSPPGQFVRGMPHERTGPEPWRSEGVLHQEGVKIMTINTPLVHKVMLSTRVLCRWQSPASRESLNFYMSAAL